MMVDECNRVCEISRDELFGIGLTYLRPIKGAKFYAPWPKMTAVGSLDEIGISYRTKSPDPNVRCDS
jgi:hypothetical protein